MPCEKKSSRLIFLLPPSPLPSPISGSDHLPDSERNTEMKNPCVVGAWPKPCGHILKESAPTIIKQEQHLRIQDLGIVTKKVNPVTLFS